jgi:hypothetical protein
MPDFRAELREAHERDLAVEAAEGVHFEHVWLDPVSGKVFCLSSGPSKEAVLRVHDKAGQGTHRGDLRAGGRGRIAGARWGSRRSSVWAGRAIARPAHTHVAHSMQRGREPNSHCPLGQSVALPAAGQDVARPGGWAAASRYEVRPRIARGPAREPRPPATGARGQAWIQQMPGG